MNIALVGQDNRDAWEKFMREPLPAEDCFLACTKGALVWANIFPIGMKITPHIPTPPPPGAKP